MTNEHLNERIDALWKQTKDGLLERIERMEAISALIEAYIVMTGDRPPSQALDRMASMILHEEDTDKTPWKTRNTEFPFQSPRRQQDILRFERGDSHLAYLNTEGNTDHMPPVRRVRSKYEHMKVDQKAHGPHKVSKVTSYKIQIGEVLL